MMKIRNGVKWTAWGILLAVIFSAPFLRTTPEGIAEMLSTISQQARPFSLMMHILFLAVIITGLFIERLRNLLFFLFMSLITITAALYAVLHRVFPNVILFLLILVLMIHAFRTGRLHWEFKNMPPINLIVGIMSLVCGFWYLHWVEPPVWLNALFYSPLGAVNCPTLATLCGFLAMTTRLRSVMLEATVVLATLFSAGIGLFMLAAYIDVVLIISALFLLVRLGPYADDEGAYEKSRKNAQPIDTIRRF